MRDIPPTKDADTLYVAQSRYDLRAQPLRRKYPDFFPLDVRDFRPQPWLLPDVGPDYGSSSLYEMYRSFGTPPNQRPPPLEKNYRITEFTRALHHKDAPDWSHPEIIWGELQSLNLSTPLNVPPSIIFWSIVHELPVYMHPDYRAMSRRGPFAHPYACSEYVFSDESAADYRAELGIPPLDDAQPLRPGKALEVMPGRTITDEGEIAERVALLQSKGELPSKLPAEIMTISVSPESEKLLKPAATSSKRERMSDVDVDLVLSSEGPALSLSEGTSRSSLAPSPLETDSCALQQHASVLGVPTHPSSTGPETVALRTPTSEASPDSPATARPAKRRKTSHSPASTPTSSRSSATALIGEVDSALRSLQEESNSAPTLADCAPIAW